jgi:hypothetical protein
METRLVAPGGVEAASDSLGKRIVCLEYVWMQENRVGDKNWDTTKKSTDGYNHFTLKQGLAEVYCLS